MLDPISSAEVQLIRIHFSPDADKILNTSLGEYYMKNLLTSLPAVRLHQYLQRRDMSDIKHTSGDSSGIWGTNNGFVYLSVDPFTCTSDARNIALPINSSSRRIIKAILAMKHAFSGYLRIFTVSSRLSAAHRALKGMGSPASEVTPSSPRLPQQICE